MISSCKSETKNTISNEVKKEVVKDNKSATNPSKIATQSTNEITETSTVTTEPKNTDTKNEGQNTAVNETRVKLKTQVPKKQVKQKVITKPNSSPIRPSKSDSTPKSEKPKIKDEINLDNNSVNTKNEKEEAIDKIEKSGKPSNNTKPEKPVLYDVPVGYPNHKLFDGFLGAHVSSGGTVNYSGMKKKEADLDAYFTSLEKTKITTAWSRNDKLAFWINTYNAYTIKLILNNYPVNKITDLYAGKPWDYKWIKLDGKTLSLNNIENDIIRPDFKDPRIHFAVNCAAKSCPPILKSAFTASNLEKQLESQTKKFINNNQYNTLGKSEIVVSKIFDWYGSDFGNVASFISRYADITVKPTAKVKFNEYDWSLNGK